MTDSLNPGIWLFVSFFQNFRPRHLCACTGSEESLANNDDNEVGVHGVEQRSLSGEWNYLMMCDNVYLVWICDYSVALVQVVRAETLV